MIVMVTKRKGQRNVLGLLIQHGFLVATCFSQPSLINGHATVICV